MIPHCNVGKLIDRQEAKARALTQTLDHVEAAVFLVGGDGGIAFENERGRQMLNEGALVRRKAGALLAVQPDAHRILREVFASAAKGDQTVGVRGVAVPLSEQGWFAHVLPLTSGHRRESRAGFAAVAAVFIRKTAPNAPPPLESFAKIHQLTAAEVRAIDAVLKVNGAKAISDWLGVSEATVRTHLRHLFNKTGARRQSELVKLVAGL